MGKFKEWARRNWQAVIPISLAAGMYYVLFHPKGEYVKQDADGIMTAEEGRVMENKFLVIERVKGFTPEMKNFVNDFDVFAEREFLANGLDSYRFSSRLNISWESFWEKLVDVSRTSYHFSDSLIIVKNEYGGTVDFAATFHHEAGHAKAGLFSSMSEYPSMAYEFYSLLRMYSLNRGVGSIYLDYNFSGISNNLGGTKDVPYKYGTLNFLVQANKEKGNLEKAVAGIFDSYRFFVDYSDEVNNVVSEYGSFPNAFFGMFEKLIQQPDFKQGLERHMPSWQAEEYIDFLHIKALSMRIPDNMNKVLNNFIEKYKDNSDYNPYFMQEAMYLSVWIGSLDQSDKQSIDYPAIVENYLSRYHPDGNTQFNPDNALVSHITAEMTFTAGESEANAAILLGPDSEQYRQHLCNAIQWYSIAAKAEQELAESEISYVNALLEEAGLECTETNSP